MQNNLKTQSKLYTKRIPIFWWTRRWVDMRFITRELTSVFVAGYALIFLFYVRSVSQGPEALTRFSDYFTSPFSVFFHCFALVALVYHSITWFNLAPKAMVIKLGQYKIPDAVIALLNYAGWVAVSMGIIWLALKE